MFAETATVLGVGADGESDARDAGVNCLDASVEHFGKPGQLRYIADGNAGVSNRGSGPAGGYDFYAKFVQGACKFGDTSLIGDADEGALNYGHGWKVYLPAY